MNKRKKKPDCITIETVENNKKDSLNINLLQKTVEYFKKRPCFVEGDCFSSQFTRNMVENEDETTNKTSNWNKESLNNLLNGHSFDLLKQANEKYNTLRNTVLLEILEKYKKNDNDNFLSYEYLFKSILDSYKLLDEYDTQTYDPSIPKSVYVDNKIRVHNLVMKLICGSKQIDHSPSSMVVPLSNNLSQIMNYFSETGSFTDTKIQTNVIYQRQSVSISYDEIDKVAKEIDEEEAVTDQIEVETSQDNRINEIASDNRYLLFLKRTSPSLLKFCDSTDEYIRKQEEIVKEKGRLNEATLKKAKLGSLKGLVAVDGISDIEDVKWSKKDLKKFSSCVIKYKNDFPAIKEVLSHIPTKELIKKYYLSKDKTFAHIKKKPGRISDTEIKKIVEKEWTKAEINLFVEKYKSYGKSLSRYQTWINKTEKDLKIFLRYFLKQQKNLKHEVVHRTSISKEDLLSSWSVDERQIFAIYFPYFNKNWITMATYFPKKTSADLKLYYSKYFKTLSFNEQKFEASISNLKVKFGSYPVVHVGDESMDDVVLESVGLIFKK